MEHSASPLRRLPVSERRTMPARAGLALAGAPAGTTFAAHPSRPHTDTVQSIIDTALTLERLSAAVYYAGLRTPTVLRTPSLGGRSANPNDPGLPPNGDPQHVRYLQAALDAEIKHAALLVAAGARVRVTHAYVPTSALTHLGTAREQYSFLGLLDRLETISVSLYTAAVGQLLQLGRRDLALLTAQIAGIESEHRMLGRVIGGLRPANNLTLGPNSFGTVAEAAAVLHPFVTGKGFRSATRAFTVPSAAQAARVIGKYRTRRVRWFL